MDSLAEILGIKDPAAVAFLGGAHEHLRRVLTDDAMQGVYFDVMLALRFEIAIVIGCCEPAAQKVMWELLDRDEMREFVKQVTDSMEATDAR